ncbi:MAG: DDE-type integrase/transposase/recombinase [Candidatus Bathyarchaeia archaeon]|jgi:transposase-like protein
MQAVLSREEKGRMIAEKHDQVMRVDEASYKVASQSRDLSYDVIRTEKGWRCTCFDHFYRQVRCKHIIAVDLSKKLREHIQARVIEPIANIHACLFCKSEKIVKDGVRRNKSGDIQIFECRACGKYFTINLGFERMKHNPQGITTAMQMYFSGESLRNTARTLRLLGVQVSHQTVYNWIEKYTELMEKYLDKITPQVSDTWRADELFLKVKGNMKYLYALMDDQTRFWIAQEVADTKFTADIRELFRQGQRIAEKKPKTLITDGAQNFHDAYNREWYTQNKADRTEHIREIQLAGKVHNNKMERMNGELRDRERVMRTLEKSDTPILSGMQIYHNYIRPHDALKGKTPADIAGISVEGENKWMTIIQNASESSRKSLFKRL